MVHPAGPQIGQRESPIINEEVKPFIKKAGKSMKFLVVDASSVTFMSSMGLGMLIGMRNEAHALGAKPILYGANKDLMGVLAVMKIEKLFTIVKDQDSLKKVLQG
jgi:anti-anti-sigma factor